ncbi:oligosaccharide flippase family protein [Edwardsiella tarda]|uniref:oligosaccharide flippase family protein n=1 Tax=Edwardsiella tarda TaxID=636 RepID=UPI000BE47A22|nr:oligosaccharide flippase family protein [Edwardsiella tarda]ATI63201.1 hypothetical protein CPU03_02400 [Edwardsiella tarda]
MKILKDGMIYISGEILSKVMPFLMLPYLTRKLGVEEYGQLSISLSIIAICVVFFNFGQDGALPRGFYVYGKNIAGLVFRVGLLYSTLLFIIALVFSLLYHISIFILLCALTQIYFGQCLVYLQCRKDSIKYVRFQFLFSFFSSLFTILLFEFVDISVTSRLISISLTNFVLFLILLKGLGLRGLGVKNIWKGNVRETKIGFLFIFSYGWPLLIHQVAIYSKAQFDRVFLAQYYSGFDIGIYSAGFQLASIIMVVLMAINKASVPYYFEALKNGVIDKKNIYRVLFISIVICALLCMLFFLVPDKLILYFLGRDFSGASYYVKIFAMGISINIPYLILANYFFFLGKTKDVAISNIFSALIYVGLLWNLKSKGIEYVPYCLLISNIFLLFFVFMRFNKLRG